MHQQTLLIRWIRLAIAATLAVAVGIVAGGSATVEVAHAVDVAPPTAFEIDGDRTGPNDFATGYGIGLTPAPGLYPTTGLYTNTQTVDEGLASGCDIKDDPSTPLDGLKVGDGPAWPAPGSADPNGKTDLDFVDLAAEKVDVAGQIFDVLYVGYQKCGGHGTWQTALYLDNGDGILPSDGGDGDFLFIFDFDPSSGAVGFFPYRRVAGAWAPYLDNSTFIEGMAAGDYGEVALNLTGLQVVGGQDATECSTVSASGPATSLTGGSLTSDIKDLVNFAPLTISNCGSLEVHKISSPADVEDGTSFPYTVSQTDGEASHDDTLQASGVAAGGTDEPTASYGELSAAIQVNDDHTWTNVISQPDYTLVETSQPGWQIERIECSFYDIFTGGQRTVTLWDDQGATGAEFLVPPRVLGGTALDPATCTIDNATSAVTIVKAGAGDPDAEFGFTMTGQDPFVLSVVDDIATNEVDESRRVFSVAPATSFSVTETIPAAGVGEPEWTLASIECTKDSDGSVIVSETDPEDGTVDIESIAADGVTCVFTNEQAAVLTLIKRVVNDNGGTADINEWELTADGPTPLSGTSGVTGEVQPGTYVLSESGGSADYVGLAWSCVGGVLDDDVVVLAAGDVATCTIVNDDSPPSLTLVKEVVNDNGGTAVPSDWTLTAVGYDPEQPLVGTYELSESGPAGYSQVSLTCDNASGQVTSVTLGLGEDVTCTFVNDDDAPSLRLVKQVVNDNGGTAVPADWTLTATGPTGFSGTTGVAFGAGFAAGRYDLSETGPTGYTGSDWVCDGGQQLDGDTVVIGLGDTVLCTITNDDDAPSLTLVKELVNDDGGNALIDDFVLTATGPTGLSGTTGVSSDTDFSAGTYDLSENAVAGYTASAWDCVGGELLDGDTVAIGLGDEVVCTITNDDDPVDLELTKDDGGFTAIAGGDPIPYTLTVANVGERDVDPGEPATVTDILPDGLSWVEPVPTGCSVDGQTLTCVIDPADLEVGDEPVVFDLLVSVDTEVPSGLVENRAWVDVEDDPVCVGVDCSPPPCPANGNNNVDCEQTPVDRFATITVVKADDVADGDAVRQGEVYQYTLSVTNNGPSTILPGLTVDDDLPAELVLIDVDGGPDWICNDSDLVQCVYSPPLGVDETTPVITVTVRVAANAAGSFIDNLAVATGYVETDCDEVEQIGDLLGACAPIIDEDSERTPLEVVVVLPPEVLADLAIVKSASVTGPVGTGSSFNWILQVTNEGPDPAVDVVVADAVPASLEIGAVSSSFFDCSAAGQQIRCTRASMAVGASGSVTIAVTVRDDFPGGVVENIATVESDTRDPDLTNNSDSASIDVVVQFAPITTVVQELPKTGSDSPAELLRAAGILVLAGLAVVIVTRRRPFTD